MTKLDRIARSVHHLTALAAARRRGKRIGRPRAIRGSDSFEMERMLRNGKSFGAVARKLNCHTSTVSREAKRLGLAASV